MSEEDLHPIYSAQDDNFFVKDLYRLKGFANLGCQHNYFMLNKDEEQEFYVVKAATNFQKALGAADSHIISHLTNYIRN